ncbi:helix-turn-helix transcriptional regulator [Bacillaceae bacterium S4-13-58]
MVSINGKISINGEKGDIMVEYMNPSKFSLGQKLKHLRSLKKIKQLELAKGICSVSYLSKVENDLIVPSVEIKDLLLKRLNLDTNSLEFNSNFHNKLNEWQSLIVKNSINEAELLYKNLLLMIGPFINIELQLKFKLCTISYFVTKRDFIYAAKAINEIEDGERAFSLETKYFFNRYVGEYYYYQFDFNKSLEYFLESVKLLPTGMAEKSDQAKLFYSLAMAASKSEKFHISITYGNKALELYKSLYNFKKCVDCHVLLGITSLKISNYEDSLLHYKSAKELAISGNYDQMLYIINHNLGNLYSYLGESEKALEYYYECFGNDDEIIEEYKMETIICIVEELYITAHIQEMKKWIDRGLTFS